MRLFLAALLLLGAGAAKASEFSKLLESAQRSLREEACRLAAGGPPVELRFLSYNVHGVIPWLQSMPGSTLLDTRYREMGRRLKALRGSGRGPQIVAVQEFFLPTADALVKEAGYPYVRYGAGPRLGAKKAVGSGLVVMSEYPILYSETVNYPDRDCTGWDCWANKGALHVRVLVPGLEAPVDVYTTHTNADEAPTPPEDSFKARLAQLPTLIQFIRQTHGRGPVLVAGDFNFFGGTPDYSFFEKGLDLIDVEEACQATGRCGGAPSPAQIWSSSVDHHFFLPSSGYVILPVHVEQDFTEPWKGRPLSDHWGIEARYLLQAVPPAACVTSN